VYGSLERPADAERVIREATISFPDSATPAVTLAIFYHGQERWDDAVAALEPWATRALPDAGALYQLGRTGALSGKNLDRGEAALLRYLELDPPRGQPSHAAARWRLGLIHEHRGHTDQAREQYRAALGLEPDFQPAKDALKRLGG
jgi:tetratricopeptide (TPR) repeat protein